MMILPIYVINEIILLKNNFLKVHISLRVLLEISLLFTEARLSLIFCFDHDRISANRTRIACD